MNSEVLHNKTVKAVYSPNHATYNEVFTDPALQSAPVYELSLGLDVVNSKKVLREAGKAQLVWDNNTLWIATAFQDSSIVARGDSDAMPHYRLGDTCEVFLKPVDQPWYWEIWATPKAKKTSVLWAQRDNLGCASGEVLADLVQQGLSPDTNMAGLHLDIIAYAAITKKGWDCRIGIPFKGLDLPRQTGRTQQWLILLARQNYFGTNDKTTRELTMTPQLTRSSFDRYEEYALLELVK